MPGPWEDYQAAAPVAEHGPWEDYGGVPAKAPSPTTGQHVQGHPLKGQNFGDWLSEELLGPIVASATQLGKGLQGLGHPEQRPLAESAKDVLAGGTGITVPFALGGLGGPEVPAPGTPAPPPGAVGTAVKGAAGGLIRAIPNAAETSILRYTGAPQLVRGAVTGAKQALAARQAAMAPPAATVDPLLDQVAQGFGLKDFASANPADQLMVRDLASRINGASTTAPPAAPPAYVPRPPEYYGVKPAEVPPENPAPSAPAPAPASAAPTPKVQSIKPEASTPTSSTSPEASNPVPEAPPASKSTAADIAKSNNAQAKADRFVRAIQQYNEKHTIKGVEPISADFLAGLDDSAKAVLARSLSANGLLPKLDANKFPFTSWPYIVTKLRQAEYTAR